MEVCNVGCKSDMISCALAIEWQPSEVLGGCVRRVAAQDREGKPGQATIFCPPAVPDRMMLSSLMPDGVEC